MPIDISATYLGLRLPSPIVIGACPMTASIERVRQLACSGAGAIVLPSLFEEQIVRNRETNDRPVSAEELDASEQGYRTSLDTYNGGVTEYLQTIEILKRTVAVPVIASLNGWTGGTWLRFARDIEQAGADALELNLHDYSDTEDTTSEAIEDRLVGIVNETCELLSIPVAVKLRPFYTSLPKMAWKLAGAGAQGLVLFGHDPELVIYLDSLTAGTSWQLTPPGAISLTLAGLTRIRPACGAMSLAASGGISSASDAIKTLLAGADVAMVTSVLYREGTDVIELMLDGIIAYLERKRIESLSSLLNYRVPALDFQAALKRRLDYTVPLTTFIDDKRELRQPTLMHGDRWGHTSSKLDDSSEA